MSGPDRSPSPLWNRLAVLTGVVALLAGACSGTTDNNSDQEAATTVEGLQIVATTTILGDLARNVVGDGGHVEVLMPVGADPHDYQASSQQIADISNADLVIANGLHLEEGLNDVLNSLRDDGANVFEVGTIVDPLAFAGNLGADAGTCDVTLGNEVAGACDPHIWLDPARMATATRGIAAELAKLDSTVDWAAQAESYTTQLMAADSQIESILAVVPEGDRKIVTNHMAFGYFAARYDFAIVGVVVPGGSTLAEPSSAELAALVDVIRSENVPAIFAETTEPTTLSEAAAAEAGDNVEVVKLYTGSLGEPGTGADTLIGMLTTNATRIAEALS